MKKLSAFLATVALLSVVGWQAEAEKPCEAPDNFTSVSGTGHCLQIRTYIPRGDPPKTLVVMLHGAQSRGGDVDGNKVVARMAARRHGAIGVVIAQPGYTLEGRTSTGTATRDTHPWYRYRAEKIDSIAAAVATLKKHHEADRLVLVGHSLGAIVSGVLLGRRAPLVDAVILIGCPCDVEQVRFHLNRKQSPHALSPIDFLDAVPKSASILALTGENDRVTPPFIAERYVKKARELGLDATFSLVENAGHRLGRRWRDAVNGALRRAVNPR